MIVFPGGGYVEHAPHEVEPIVDWLSGLGGWRWHHAFIELVDAAHGPPPR
ncbi:hypothetical protein [Streptomyces sp. ISID311]|nr:hypothetical protein [Streptomyces sp. ISID311]